MSNDLVAGRIVPLASIQHGQRVRIDFRARGACDPPVIHRRFVLALSRADNDVGRYLLAPVLSTLRAFRTDDHLLANCS